MQYTTIEAYSLYEFCQKIQEKIQEGFVFDFESNVRFPTAFGNYYCAGLVKNSEELEKLGELEVKTKPVRITAKKVIESN